MYCSPENPQRWEVAKTTKKHACFSYKIFFLKSFWDAFELKFFILSPNSLMVKLIQSQRLREALLLT